MENLQIIKTLDRKAAEIELWLSNYNKLVEQKQADLVHLRATIALMKSGQELTDMRAPSMSVARIFKRGELYQRCLALLERSAELDTSELATDCLKAKNLDPNDRGLRRAMTQQIIQVLHIHKGGGQIVSSGKRAQTKVWCLAKGKMVA